MTSEERAINWISCNIDNKDEVYREGILYTLKRLLDHHAAEARAEQREKVAAWMIHNGYSTGHGDTIEELLEELKDQLKKSPHDEG